MHTGLQLARAPECPSLQEGTNERSQITLKDCSKDQPFSSCHALVFQPESGRLVNCPLHNSTVFLEAPQIFARSWLGSTEELTTVASCKCSQASGYGSNCLISSTKHCLAEMVSHLQHWVPKRLFCNHKDTRGPWDLAVFRDRYLAMLEEMSDHLQVVDLWKDPHRVGMWRLTVASAKE